MVANATDSVIVKIIVYWRRYQGADEECTCGVGGGAAMHQRLHAYHMCLGKVFCTVSAEDGALWEDYIEATPNCPGQVRCQSQERKKKKKKEVLDCLNGRVFRPYQLYRYLFILPCIWCFFFFPFAYLTWICYYIVV